MQSKTRVALGDANVDLPLFRDLSSNRLVAIPPNLFLLLEDLLQLWVVFAQNVHDYTVVSARIAGWLSVCFLVRNISYNPIMELQVDHFDKLAKLKSLWVESRVENENFKMEESQTLKQIKMKWIVVVLLTSIALKHLIMFLYSYLVLPLHVTCDVSLIFQKHRRNRNWKHTTADVQAS